MGSEEIGNLKRQNFERNLRANQQLLEKEAKRGRLRTDVDADTLAFTITQIGQGLEDWLEMKHGITFGGNVDPETFEAKEAQIQEEVHQILQVMKTGFWNA